MAMNRIQFQPGLSMPAFLRNFGSEPQCEQALEAARWPEGFRCPRCAGTSHYVLRDGTRKVFQCQACRHQASLIAGTMFQGTKLPLLRGVEHVRHEWTLVCLAWNLKRMAVLHPKSVQRA